MSQSLAEVRALNEAFFEKLATPGMDKVAASEATEFTRTRVREGGFYPKIMPEILVTSADLAPQVDTDKPVMVVEKQPNSPGAVTVPFATLPTGFYIRGPKYRITFARVMTRMFIKDLSELRTWRMDIRQVISDNSVKDMLAEIDSKFLTAVNSALVGPDQVVPTSGVAQWQTIFGGISRETLEEGMTIMPQTPSHLEAKTALANSVTRYRILSWGRDEVGGDAAQDMLMKGWTSDTFMGAEWIWTIKRDLVPDDSVYYFGPPDHMGKNCYLEDTTMFVKREAFMIMWYLYKELGGALGHFGALARADYA
jgi:hypothetical protein